MTDILNKNRVKLVSLIMIFFVVTIHTNLEYFYSLSKTTTMVDKILSNCFKYIQNGICRVAVPYFMFKAGYLYFINFDGTIDNYKKKSIRRLKSLVIPYILWNFVNWLFTYLICIIPFISKYVANREPIPINLINMFKIIFLREAFLPNWFLQYLIIFSFIIPLFYKFLKNVFGLIIIFINIYIYILTRSSYIYYLSFYLVGVYFSLNVKFLKNKINPMILCMTFLFFSYFVYKNEMNIVLSIIVHILNVLCIWYASVLIPDLYPLGLDISFLIYETHEIIFSIVFKFLYIVLPKTILCGIINYILMLFFGFIITYIIFNMVKKINSKVYYFIGGK